MLAILGCSHKRPLNMDIECNYDTSYTTVSYCFFFLKIFHTVAEKVPAEARCSTQRPAAFQNRMLEFRGLHELRDEPDRLHGFSLCYQLQ